MSNRRGNAGPNGTSGPPAIGTDRNQQRRAKYAQDAGIREETKRASRTRYREANPLPQPKLTRGLLTTGTRREVATDDGIFSGSLNTYTIIEAAEALGRSLPNFRRWVNNEIIPSAILRETSRNLFCYCSGELQLIAEILATHERDYAYLCEKHSQVIEEIAQAIHGFRDIHFGESYESTSTARPANRATRTRRA